MPSCASGCLTLANPQNRTIRDVDSGSGFRVRALCNTDSECVAVDEEVDSNEAVAGCTQRWAG